MSRVGIKPIPLLEGVEVSLNSEEVGIKGPKGELRVPFNPIYLEVCLEDGSVQVSRKSEDRTSRSLHGLTRSLIANAVTGVTEGFFKNLEVFGIGYRAEAQGRRLTLHIGYSRPVVYDAPEGIELVAEDVRGDAQARIVIRGIDKQVVGQVAADIRFKRKPDSYKGKGIRYENEIVHLKPGKAAVA